MKAKPIDVATSHIKTILTKIFGVSLDSSCSTQTLLVYDEGSPLAKLISSVYRQLLPRATQLHFDQTDVEKIKGAIELLSAGDLVILVQSSSFRLDAFRIRVHLFERGLKVIEHPHLGRVREEEIETYIASLAYDEAYYQRVGPALKKRLDQASEVRLESDGNTLIYGGAFELAKLNIGDYRGMKNIGGQFPIGEVFTELRDLTHLNGKVALFAFGDQSFSVHHCEPREPPLVLEIKEGRVVFVHHAPPEFEAVLEEIRNHEGEVWVRELGFGLNRALTRTTLIRHDVGIYERMCGIHLSLGSKHALYPKAGFHKKKVKFHVDVFAVVDTATIDGSVVYKDGAYVL